MIGQGKNSLVYTSGINEGLTVLRGDLVEDSRGEVWEVTGWREPQHLGSTGRVYVKHTEKDWNQEFFPAVFNMEFPREYL